MRDPQLDLATMTPQGRRWVCACCAAAPDSTLPQEWKQFLWHALGATPHDGWWCPTLRDQPALCAQVQDWLDQLLPARQATLAAVLAAQEWIGLAPSEGVPHD
jgi:hypothetical protein